MINIAITMAGTGSRFVKAGYEDPKAFINVCGQSMIKLVLDNLKVDDAKYLLLAQKKDAEKYNEVLSSIKECFNCDVYHIPKVTEGAACTFLSIAQTLNIDCPLILAYCDQIVDMKIVDFVNDAKERNLDGSILTFKHLNKNNKWSYADVDASGFVTQTIEKVPISNHATVGIYYFRKGSAFVANASEMISRMDKSNGEYYISPVFNHMIRNKMKIGIYEIQESEMHGLGTPEDLIKYQKLISSNKDLKYYT